MGWFTPKFRPGINTVDPGLANEGGFAAGNLMRAWQGSIQPVGGWTLHSTLSYAGVARGSLSWRTLEGKTSLAWGTESKLYSEIAGARYDITPNLFETVLNNAFTTTNGSPNVVVYLDYHRFRAGDTVVFSNHQSTVGGLTIEGTYVVQAVLAFNRFVITHLSNATSTVTTPSGGLVDFVAPLPLGLVSNPLGGFGSEGFGEGLFGGSADSTLELRTWSMASWGEFLLANPSGYGLFEYQPEIFYPELTFNGTFTGSADGWALGTGWSYSANSITAVAGVASNLSQDIEGVVEGGKYYLVTFTVTRTAGTLKFRVNAGDPSAVIDVGTASSVISKSGTYTRLFLAPADPMDVVFEKDGAFAGTIDNVSYKLISRAYRIVTAPPRIDAMFVDPAGLVVALGTTLLDGSYSGTAYRCSDLGNNRAWVPDTNSYASEQVLRGVGGRLMAGINTSEQNLVWGDDGVLSLRFVGEFGKAFDPIFLGAGCGLISRHAMCAANGFVFWMANTKQFFAFRGISNDALGKPEILVCPIQNEVFENIDYRQQLKIHAGINSTFAEAWFFYPDDRDGDECSRIATVAWTEGGEGGVPWHLHRLERTSWVGPGTFPNPISFGPIDGTNYVFDHEVGNSANGGARGEWIDTAPFDTEEGEYLTVIREIIPELSQQIGNVDFYLIARRSPRGAPITFGPYTAGEATEFLRMRVMGRQFVLRMVGTTTGGFWRSGATRLDVLTSTGRQ